MRSAQEILTFHNFALAIRRPDHMGTTIVSSHKQRAYELLDSHCFLFAKLKSYRHVCLPPRQPGDHAEDVHMFLACQNSVSSEDGLSLPDQVSTVMRSQDISCFTESYSSADSQSPSSSTTEKSAEPRVSCLSMAFGLRSRISEQPVINPGYHSRRDDHDRRVQKVRRLRLSCWYIFH